MSKASDDTPLFRAAAAVAAVWPLLVLMRFVVSVVLPQAGLWRLDVALACVLVVVALVLATASLDSVGG